MYSTICYIYRKFSSNCHNLVKFEINKRIISFKPNLISKYKNPYNLSWALVIGLSDQSASAHTSKAIIHTNDLITGPGYSKSAEDWQMPHFTRICGFVPNARNLPPLPLKGNAPAPLFHHAP